MKFEQEHYLKLYRNLVRARAYDKLFARLLTRGKLLGFYHQAEGGEAPGVGACTFLEKDDYLWPHLRGHGIPHMAGKGVELKYFLAEHMGKRAGVTGGLSVYHPCDPERGIYGWSGSMGTGFTVSVGFGLAARKNNRRQVVVSCFGDATSNRGTLHESFLMAANWKLPVVWVCENNGLGIYVPIEESHPVKDIASLASGYGMPGVVVDGQDVVAVAETVIAAVERARDGGGPSLVECKTCRYHEHDIGTPNLAGSTPRTKEMIDRLRERDPIKVAEQRLGEMGMLTPGDIDNIARETSLELEEAERFADSSLPPDPSSLELALYAA